MKHTSFFLLGVLIIVIIYFTLLSPKPLPKAPTGEYVSGNEPHNPCEDKDCSLGK